MVLKWRAHEARTGNGVESQDSPPDVEITEPLIPSEELQASDGADLARADVQPPHKPGFMRAVLDAFDQTSRGW